MRGQNKNSVCYTGKLEANMLHIRAKSNDFRFMETFLDKMMKEEEMEEGNVDFKTKILLALSNARKTPLQGNL